MNDTTANVISYGRALVQALKSFEVLEFNAGWFERLLIKLLRTTYKQRLRAIVGDLPPETSGEILEATES